MPKPYLGEAPPGVLRVAVAVTAILLAATAGAQVCTVDAEPNDTPATAQDVSDTLCIAGSMAAQDQDAYLWVVDDEAAARWWSVSMEGIPGHLTKVDLIRVTLADNGVDVTAADTLASFTSPGGALTESAPVLVAPGRYVLGVSKSGGEGAYVVHLDPGDALRRGRRGVDGLDGVDGAFAIFGMANGEVALPWRLAADDASLRWDLELVAAVGSDARLALRGADGAEVAASGTGELGRATLRSLGVGAGEVAVSVTGLPSGAPFTLSATSAGRVTDGNEVEPNNGWDEANVLSLGRAMHGSGPDKDYFVLDVPDAARGKTYDLSLESDANAYLSLFSADHEEIQTRHGASGAMRGLVLDAPRYGVTVGVGGDASYTLVFSEASPPEDGHESEPNDVLAVADPLSDGLTVRGGLEVQDKDVYRFTTTGPAQLWRIQAVGSGVRSLTTYDAGGARQASLQGERRIRLDNVALLPGEHFIEVGGNAGAYALRALALGPVPDEKPAPPSAEDAGAQQLPLKAAAPPPQAEPEAIEPSGPPPPPGVIELEPNDDDSRAELLRVGQTRVGVLTGTNDVDAYRFYLASDQYVRIEAVPPEDGSLFFDVREAGVRAQSQGPGSPVVFQRRLLAGNYDLWLRADTASDGYYQLRMSQLDPFTLPDDVEPNDSPATANRLPADLDVEGKVGDITGPDFYALPAFDAPTTLHVDGTLGEDTRIALLGDGAPRLVRNNDGSFDADLPAGAHLFLRMNGRGDYRFVARFGSAPDASELRPPNGDPGASLALERSARDVAAYWYEGQALDDELTIENTSDRKQTYALEVATSSVAVTPHVPATVTVGPGQRASVPLSVTVAPDARDDQPVRVTVGARSDAGIATTSLTLVPRCEAAPVAPKASWAVPDAMLGRLDVAWSGLGATIVDDAGRDAQTVDALTSPATGAHHEVGEAITVDLAGDEPITLAGALLQPQGGPDVRRQLRDFSIQVSLDGETFETVLESSLRAARVEQAFAFPKAVEARYARLVFGPDQAGNSGAWIGEWKLVAAADDPLGELNLADPALGGHVLWSDPLIPESQRHSMILDEQADRPRVDGHGNPRATWVVGFRDDRAAQFTRLEWVESSDSTSEGAFSDVAVDVSLSSPVGPWEHLADWHLERDAAGTAALALPEPSWARFVRFTATGPEQGVRSMFPPDTLRILERPSGDGYRSAVGEWGQYRKEAVYEWQQGGADGAATGQTGPDAADSDSRDAPRPLASGDVVEGTVAVAEDEDWFTITVPDGQNHLSLRLEGDPTLAYNYALTSAAGDAVAYDERHDGDAVVLDAYVDPGEYTLHLAEPKRSVIFAWDTSGSVGPYIPITYASLARFTRGTDPDREFVQLLAYNEPGPIWLLPYWSADPVRAQQAINTFDRDSAESSNSENALLTASDALAQRDGTRAVLLITDAESPGYGLTPKLWRSLEASRARVFTFEISTGGSDYSQDLMQAWADANHGFYDYARNVGDFDVGFARASCLLRRPKRYRVEVTTSAEAPPGPGSIRVVRAEGAAQPAVEVIFDASGSMGKKLPDGTSRIDAAREVLKDFVTNVLPEGTPFALRVFGHIKPSSCDTRLEVPLAPLDPASATKAIDAIQPKLLSQTPLADSIAAVGDDLRRAPSGSRLFLVTDGEESCGGDPLVALQTLASAGISVSMVSLGIEDGAVQDRFRSLAQAAGASYSNLASASELRAEIKSGSRIIFEIISTQGSLVDEGYVGGPPVQVPAGHYQLQIRGESESRSVAVSAEEEVEVTANGR